MTLKIVCSHYNYLLIFLLNCWLFNHVVEGLSCHSLDQLIHSLPYVSEPGSDCTSTADCSAVMCKLSDESTVGLLLKSCDTDEPTVVISANIPSSGITSWSQAFTDQAEHIIPGFIIPPSSKFVKAPTRQGYLKASLTKGPNLNTVLFSLWLKGCQQPQTGTVSCTLVKQIINNQELSCGSATEVNSIKRIARKSSNCSILKHFECGENETCKQIGYSNDGECVCLPDFVRQDTNGPCIQSHNDTIAPTVDTKDPTSNTNTTDVPPTNDSATVAVNVLVPILVLTLVAALVYAAIKYGLISMPQFFGRMRTHGGRRLIVSEYDDEDDAPLA